MTFSRTLGLGALAMAMLSAACGGSVAGSGGSTTTGGSGGATSTIPSGGSGGDTTTTSSSVTTGSGGSTGTLCGGKLGKPCAADEFCDFGDNRCGIADGGGTCTKRPQGCPDIYQPTCGCDQQVHPSACDANAAGSDVSINGTCTAPQGLFGCGERFCTLGADYCVRYGSDVAGFPDTFDCKPLPTGCSAAATCSCLINETCGGNCAPTSDGGLEVTCPGG